jgi:prevent-host-death family protein
METTISQRELRNDSGAIMRRVEQGERFTVTRNGVPVADLLPHDLAAADRRRRFVPVAEVAAGVSQLASWDVERFAAEQRELDVAVDDSDAERWGTAR